MTSTFRTCVIILTSAVVAMSMSTRLKADSTNTVDHILEIWKARAEAVTSLRCTWTVTRTDRAGSLTAALANAAKVSESFPPADVTYTINNSLALDGVRLRHRSDGQTWYMGRKEQKLKKHITDSVFDGTETRMLHYDHPESATKHAAVMSSSEVGIQSDIMGSPIFYYIRPIDSIAHHVKDMRDSLRVIPAGGDAPDIIRLERPSGERGSTFFDVDPMRDYHILRVVRHRDGVERMRLSINYERDITNRFVPQEWSMVNMDSDGRERSVQSAQVTSFQVNAPLAYEDFELLFPPGITVRGENGQKLMVDNDGNIIRPGSKPPSSFPTLTIVGLGLMTIGIMILIVRRRSRVMKVVH